MAVEASHDAFKSEYADLMKELTEIAEDLGPTVTLLQEQAADASHTATMLASKRIDNDTVSETQQLAKTLDGIQSGVDTVIAGTDDAVRFTRVALDQLKTTHDGTQEAMHRSPVDNHTLAGMDPDWITPE